MLTYQRLNGALPSKKCSIKAPTKWSNSDHVETEICHQRSKWLGPYVYIVPNAKRIVKVSRFFKVNYLTLTIFLTLLKWHNLSHFYDIPVFTSIPFPRGSKVGDEWLWSGFTTHSKAELWLLALLSTCWISESSEIWPALLKIFLFRGKPEQNVIERLDLRLKI